MSPSSSGTCSVDQFYIFEPTEHVPPEDGDTIQSPKHVLNDRKMNIVQNCENIMLD
jgi:hypothetical protein